MTLLTLEVGLGRLLRRWSDQRGQAMAEMALIIALVAVTAILALTLFGDQTAGIIDGVAEELKIKKPRKPRPPHPGHP